LVICDTVSPICREVIEQACSTTSENKKYQTLLVKNMFYYNVAR